MVNKGEYVELAKSLLAQHESGELEFGTEMSILLELIKDYIKLKKEVNNLKKQLNLV